MTFSACSDHQTPPTASQSPSRGGHRAVPGPGLAPSHSLVVPSRRDVLGTWRVRCRPSRAILRPENAKREDVEDVPARQRALVVVERWSRERTRRPMGPDVDGEVQNLEGGPNSGRLCRPVHLPQRRLGVRRGHSVAHDSHGTVALPRYERNRARTVLDRTRIATGPVGDQSPRGRSFAGHGRTPAGHALLGGSAAAGMAQPRLTELHRAPDPERDLKSPRQGAVLPEEGAFAGYQGRNSTRRPGLRHRSEGGRHRSQRPPSRLAQSAPRPVSPSSPEKVGAPR